MPVYKDKERGTWYFEFTKIINGKKIRAKKRGFSSKTEAVLAEQSEIDDLLHPKVKIENCTLSDLFNKYIVYKKTKTKITTLDGIKRRYKNHVAPAFGNKKLNDLSSSDIFDWKNKFVKCDFSESFTNMVIGEFRSLIQFGINKNYILNNSLLDELENVSMNKIVNERSVLTIEQINKFLDSFIKDEPSEYEYWLYFYAFAYSGMRPNEFRCLQVKDIQGDYLIVNKSITSKLGKDDVIQTPKNINSNRRVLMPHDIIVLLLDHVKGYKPDDFIFGKNKAFRETNLNRKLNLHLKVAGLPKIVLYGFRHSHATNLIKAGVPIKVVSKRLGHKNASTTMNVYWHLFQDDESQVLEILHKK